MNLLLLLVLVGCGYAAARDDTAVLVGIWTLEYKHEISNRTQSQ